MNKITISTGHPDAGRVYAKAYGEALAREAALRESLTDKRDEYNKLGDRYDALQQRLTIAEQRAATITEALEGMIEYFPEGHSDGECFSVERARAALKPAEEGEGS